jgi:hypothetical protein
MIDSPPRVHRGGELALTRTRLGRPRWKRWYDRVTTG